MQRRRIYGIPLSKFSKSTTCKQVERLGRTLLHSAHEMPWILELIEQLRVPEQINDFLLSFQDNNPSKDNIEHDFTNYEQIELETNNERYERLRQWKEMIGQLTNKEVYTYAKTFMLDTENCHRIFNHYQKEIQYSPRYYYDALSQKIVAQEEAKKVISYAVYCHQLSIRSFNTNQQFPRHNILLTGPSGAGKSFIASECAKLIDVPFIKIDAASLVKSGIIGNSIADYFQASYKMQKDGSMLEYAVVFIDEIDKLAQHFSYDCLRIQTELLTVLGEGGQVSFEPYRNATKKRISCEKMLFILGGAFEKLRNKILEGPIGFSKIQNGKQSDSPEIIGRDILINNGFLPELVNRIHRIVELRKLEKADFIEILKTSKSSELELYQNYASLHGNKIHFTDDFIEALAEKAASSNMNGRSIKNLMAELMTEILIECADVQNKEYVINEEFLT